MQAMDVSISNRNVKFPHDNVDRDKGTEVK